MPDEPALVLFDIDGTMMRGAGPHHRLALEAGIRRELNLRATTDGIDTAGSLDRDLITLMLAGAQVPPQVTAAALERIVIACESAYLEGCADNLRRFVLPGVFELLQALQAKGASLGVVTGNLQAIGWKKLELAGLREYFEVGAFSQDGTTRAALARRAAERAADLKGVSQFRSITLVGDHRNDIAAAKANRFRSIAVATGVLGEEDLWREEPDRVVRNMTELSAADLV